MIRRKAREQLERRRDLTAAAFWANSNYDQPEVNRSDIIQELERRYADVINAIYEDRVVGALPTTEEVEPGNPFFDAMRRSMERPAEGEEPLIEARNAKLDAQRKGGGAGVTVDDDLSATPDIIARALEIDEG
jgi:hypothetical protein